MKEKYNWHTCVCTAHPHLWTGTNAINIHKHNRLLRSFGEMKLILVKCGARVRYLVPFWFHFIWFCFVFFIFVWIAGLNHRFKIKRHCLINNNVILMIQLSWCDYSHTFSVCRFQYCIKYIRYDEGGRVDAREMWMTCGVAGWVVLREGGGRRVWINTPKIEQGSNTLSALQHKWILSRRRRWWQCGWLFFEVFLLLLLSP